MEIYNPAEDSYLLAEVVKNYLNNLIKDIKKKDKRNSEQHKNSKPYNQDGDINYTKIKGLKILDMGSGSGIQALICRQLGYKNILAADIDSTAIAHLKKQKIRTIKTNLFSNIDNKEKFDIIIFNPPYLPEHKYDKKPDTTAGKQGYELIIKFLKQAKNYLNKNNKRSNILLLFSSLSHPEIIKQKARQLGYEYKLLGKKSLFFEQLYVYNLFLKAS